MTIFLRERSKFDSLTQPDAVVVGGGDPHIHYGSEEGPTLWVG